MKRDPGLLLLGLALALAMALYAPTIARGIVNYDDPWLIADNWIIQNHDIGKVFTDTSVDTRAVLGAEYLPVRDLSVMLDDTLWGDWYGGHHLTNLVVYLAAIALWFAALTRLGLDRTLVGVAVLIWAVLPAHAESVAWLSERKGLLALMFAGASTLAFANFRDGRKWWWIGVAILAAVLAVWSKALALFMLAPLVLVARDKRGWLGIVAMFVAAALAFVPVLLVARQMSVVAGADAHSVNPLAIHGFYVRLAAMTMRNSVAYPIATDGASTVDIIIGTAALMAAIAALLPRVPSIVRLGGAMWLAGWFPVSRLVLPVKLVVVADRYLLFPTLGLALVLAWALWRVPYRRVLVAAIVIAGCARTLDAQANWRDARTLWARAVDVSPRDGDAWSQYIEALDESGAHDAAESALATALSRSNSAKLLMREGLLLNRRGDRSAALVAMQRAAEAGEPLAMSNLAVMLFDEGNRDDAIEWAQRGVARLPLYVNGLRVLGRVTLGAGRPTDALAPFQRALALEPRNAVNHYNLAVTYIALGDRDRARKHAAACAGNPVLAARLRGLLGP